MSLEEGIEHIGAEAFRECIGLYEISIPDSVVSIGENAFAELNPRNMATHNQKAILENLITIPSPDNSFLWPLDLVIQKENMFGYIMDIRIPEYKNIVDMLKRKAEPSFYVLCRLAFNLTKGYQKLHSIGYCYRDINFGNAFFNPDTGNVLICDNDNVSVNGMDNSNVYGTPRFMAPEIVIGKAKPSRNTDLFSLQNNKA